MGSDFDKWKERKKREAAYTVKSIGMHKVHYLFLAPYAVLFLAFYILPVAISIFFSFTYYNIFTPPKFNGLQNYINLMLSDDIFLIAVKNTFMFAVVTGPLGYMMSFMFAWLIHELPRYLRSVMTVIFYAPAISGQVYMVFATFFSADAYGWVNALLINWGIINAPIFWLTDPKYMQSVIIIAILWTSLGSGFLSFIAGLQTVGADQYEAGYVDGIKNRWQELWFITLPNMKPMLLFGAVMAITQSFNIADVTIALAGNPSTDYATRTVVEHLMDYGSQRYDMGYASAIATILFLIMILSKKAVGAMINKVGT